MAQRVVVADAREQAAHVAHLHALDASDAGEQIGAERGQRVAVRRGETDSGDDDAGGTCKPWGKEIASQPRPEKQYNAHRLYERSRHWRRRLHRQPLRPPAHRRRPPPGGARQPRLRPPRARSRRTWPFHPTGLGNESERWNALLRKEKIDLVMHFAAYCYVGESVTDPLKYYFNNVAAPLHLLRSMMAAGVKKFVFSSTCATYGIRRPRCRSTRVDRRRPRSIPMGRRSSTSRTRSRPSPAPTA